MFFFDGLFSWFAGLVGLVGLVLNGVVMFDSFQQCYFFLLVASIGALSRLSWLANVQSKAVFVWVCRTLVYYFWGGCCLLGQCHSPTQTPLTSILFFESKREQLLQEPLSKKLLSVLLGRIHMAMGQKYRVPKNPYW